MSSHRISPSAIVTAPRRRAVFAFVVPATLGAIVPLALAHAAGTDTSRATSDAGVVRVATRLRSEGGAPQIAAIAPDPTPFATSKKWVFDLRYDKGDLFFLAARPLTLPSPQPTARVMGRFALELFEGPTLIERVRFDFPLLGADPPQTPSFFAPPSFAKGLASRVGVVMPDVARGTRLELWDRATDRRWQLPWPLPPGGVDRTMADSGPADSLLR